LPTQGQAQGGERLGQAAPIAQFSKESGALLGQDTSGLVATPTRRFTAIRYRQHTWGHRIRMAGFLMSLGCPGVTEGQPFIPGSTLASACPSRFTSFSIFKFTERRDSYAGAIFYFLQRKPK
jgi:hypothetical protein